MCPHLPVLCYSSIYMSPTPLIIYLTEPLLLCQLTHTIDSLTINEWMNVWPFTSFVSLEIFHFSAWLLLSFSPRHTFNLSFLRLANCH